MISASWSPLLAKLQELGEAQQQMAELQRQSAALQSRMPTLVAELQGMGPAAST